MSVSGINHIMSCINHIMSIRSIIHIMIIRSIIHIMNIMGACNSCMCICMSMRMCVILCMCEVLCSVHMDMCICMCTEHNSQSASKGGRGIADLNERREMAKLFESAANRAPRSGLGSASWLRTSQLALSLRRFRLLSGC